MSTNSPRYFLGATPEPSIAREGRAVIQDFYSVGGKAAQLLERPPETRYASFGVATLGDAQLIDSKYMEVSSPFSMIGNVRKVLRLHADGTLVFSGDGGGGFLGWPREEEDYWRAPRVNQVVVADSAVSFARLCKALTGLLVARPASWRFSVGVRDAIGSGAAMYLMPGPLRDQHRMDESFERNTVLGPNVAEEVTVPTELLLMEASDDKNLGADATAFKIVSAFYSLFGLQEDAIPYSAPSAVGSRISVRLFDPHAY